MPVHAFVLPGSGLPNVFPRLVGEIDQHWRRNFAVTALGQRALRHSLGTFDVLRRSKQGVPML
jgi:hypothetical protein